MGLGARTGTSTPAPCTGGSSHDDLPPVLRWFTANIGIHHVHHLASRIPCYRLGEALRDTRSCARSVARRSWRASTACVSPCGTRTSTDW